MHAPELPAPPPVERLAGTQLYIPETAIFNLTMDKMGIKQFHLVCAFEGKTCLHICSLSPGAPRRTPGEDLSCPSWCSLSLGTSRGVPGEGLSAYL